MTGMAGATAVVSAKSRLRHGGGARGVRSPWTLRFRSASTEARYWLFQDATTRRMTSAWSGALLAHAVAYVMCLLVWFEGEGDAAASAWPWLLVATTAVAVALGCHAFRSQRSKVAGSAYVVKPGATARGTPQDQAPQRVGDSVGPTTPVSIPDVVGTSRARKDEVEHISPKSAGSAQSGARRAKIGGHDSAGSANVGAGSYLPSPMVRVANPTASVALSKDLDAIVELGRQSMFSSHRYPLVVVLLCVVYAVTASAARTALAGDDEAAVRYGAGDSIVAMLVCGCIRVVPLDFITSTLVLFSVVVTFIVASADAWGVDGGAVDAAFALLEVVVAACIVGTVNYVGDRSRRERFLLSYTSAKMSRRMAEVGQSLLAPPTPTSATRGAAPERLMKKLENSHNHSMRNMDFTDTLRRLDEAVLNGDIRRLYYAANSSSLHERMVATARLSKFMTIAHQTLQCASTMGQSSERIDRVRTALNAMAVAAQWMNKMKVTEGGDTGAVDDGHQVFLGGSCNPTTWRRDIAMPLLERAGVTYYNPQVDEWSEELIAVETRAKASATLLLFVIDGLTRAIVSMNEVTELICRGRQVVLVTQDIEDGCEIGDERITGRELKDLNRGRSYLRELAGRSGVAVFETVEEAVHYCVRFLGMANGAFGSGHVTPSSS